MVAIGMEIELAQCGLQEGKSRVLPHVGLAHLGFCTEPENAGVVLGPGWEPGNMDGPGRLS